MRSQGGFGLKLGKRGILRSRERRPSGEHQRHAGPRQRMQHFGGNAARTAGHQHDCAVGQCVARRGSRVDFGGLGSEDCALSVRVTDFHAAASDRKFGKQQSG